MLHKKKRWTAAMHGAGQSPIPVLLPAASSPTKTQWSNFSPSTGNKPVSRHPTPPSSTQMFKQQPPPAHSVQHSVDGFSAASQLNLSRTTTTTSTVDGARLSSPTIPSVVSDAISGFCTPGMRNEVAVSLLNSIAQSTELLQQPGLLLQILPQEYIEKYTKGLERRIASDKAAYDLVNCAVKTDGNSRPNEMATPPALYRGGSGGQPLHPSESHHSSPAGSSNNATGGHKPTSFVEQGKPTRSTPTMKCSGSAQAPLFSCPVTSNPEPQRFSPARHSSGSSDSHPNTAWTRTVSSPSSQPPSGLDYSTASAVAHAASLLHTASRSSAANALFSPWDSHNQGMMPQIAREMNARPDPTANASYSHTMSTMVPASVGFYPDGRNVHMNRSPGNSANMQRHRTPHDAPQPSAQASAPINLKPAPDPRRPAPKTAVIPTCRPLDVRMHVPGKNCASSMNETAARSFHANPTWVPAEQLANPSVGPSHGSETAADARLSSILHDAKMAALSADWPSSGSPGNNNASLKHQRTRSSSSFSSPMSSSSSEVSPMLHIPTQQTHASRNASVRDVFHASSSASASSSSSMISATQNALIHPRPSITCSSPILITKPVKSSPSGHSPVYPTSLAAVRQGTAGGQSPSPAVSNSLLPGGRGAVPIHNRPLEEKLLPTHLHGTPYTLGKTSIQLPHAYNNNNSKSVNDPWTKTLSHNPPKPTSLTVNTTCAENSSSKQPATDRSCSLMPLKKRLIQRYEADTGSEQLDHMAQKLSPSSYHSHSAYLVASGQTSSTADFAAGSQHPRLLIASQSPPIPAGQKTMPNAQSPSFDGSSKATQDDSSELKAKPQTQGFPHRSDDIPERKSVKRSNNTAAAHRRSGGLNGARKVGSGTRLSDGCVRSAKPMKYETDNAAAAIKTEPTEVKATRKSIARQRSGRAERFPVQMDDGALHRLAASSNGTFSSTSVSRIRRTDSSASRGSSSSLRSLEAETDDSEDDRVYHSDQVPDSRRTGKPSTDRANIDHSAWDSNHSLNDRVRKPKRAAALVASAAAAASVTTNAKRPRLTTHADLGVRRNPGAPDEDSVEDESLDTDDACSVMTTDSKCTNATNPENCSPILEELSAVLVEDKTTIEELLQQLPGPPDLQLLTDRSLHPTHTLDHYKRSRTPFVQLVSCNDPGLKPIPKCRACRQLKRSHYDANDPDLADPVSDEDGRMDNVSVLSKSSSTAGRTTPASSTVSGQFKRPAGGRNSLTDRDKSRDGSNDGTPAKSEKSRRKTVASSPVSVFCRFWGFRKLMFNNRGILKIAGFCQSNEASAVDRSLWEMHHSVSPPLDPDNAKYIVERAGTLFCRLLRQELAVLTTHRGQDPNLVDRGPGAPSKNGLRRGSSAAVALRTPYSGTSVAWKRPVKGVREMCDVCETTMFNTHWVCAKCGYSVCVDCQEEAREHKRNRKSDGDSDACDMSLSRDRNKVKQPRTRAGPPGWASCTTTRQHHDPDRLLLTSLLPASTVGKLLHRVHRIARHYQIRLACGCPVAGPQDVPLVAPTSGQQPTENSLGLLADVALKSNTPEPPSTVAKREWDLMQYVSGLGSSSSSTSCDGGASQRIDEAKPLPPHTWIRKPYHPLSPPKHKTEADECNTAKYLILQLHNSQSPGVLEAFRHEWQTNRPVVISGCQTRFDSSLWSPRSFADEFGPLRTTLVDCATGMELTRYPLRTFWDGFERKSRRLVSKDGRPLCLKLKDWPTTDDFAELQPNRFADLMNNLPLPCYTCRDGQMNLSSRLASFFVCPDLGPKLYVAYGTGGSRSMGTTNLHVDIADAINIMLYVGSPMDSAEESNANAEAVLNVMRQAQLDPIYLDRATRWMKSTQSTNKSGPEDEESNASGDPDHGPPGALWHIFLPEDMPALREFLTRITEEETGAPLESGSDPVHDQLFYLDQPLLDRLYSFAGILPCTLVQFKGDAVFIPAGAAHQVRNLNSCIKAAVDFVSPEHLPQCFQLIEEFRRLSSTHQNHEDKLQVKNMLFHATKDALASLLASESRKRPTNNSGEPLSPLMPRFNLLVDQSNTESQSAHKTEFGGFTKPEAADSDSSEPSGRSCGPHPARSVVRGRPPGRPRSSKSDGDPTGTGSKLCQSPRSDDPSSRTCSSANSSIIPQPDLPTWSSNEEARRQSMVVSPSRACGGFDQ